MRRPIASTERSVIMTPMSVGLRMTGTVEFGGMQLPPDPRRHALLRRHMQALLPGIRLDAASTWMGFRPSLPDHLPVLGAAPRHSGVFFAFGHQHLGLTLCGVTARILSELMLGRAGGPDLSAYRIDRF
jgi:D-amino-acid dehydrogenase